LKLARFEGGYKRRGKAFFDKVITIPHVFITGEAEEMIGDAAAGRGEVDLIRSAHTEMLADDVWDAENYYFLLRSAIRVRSAPPLMILASN
jgi:hypothetical protein